MSDTHGPGAATERPRVVITGMGVVSCLGTGVNAFWRALLDRRYGIRPLTRIDAKRHKIAHGGEVAGFDLRPDVDPALQFLSAAADEAAMQAGLAEGAFAPERAACCFGTNFGTMDSTGRFLADVASGAASDHFPGARIGHATHTVAEERGLKGITCTLSLSCASANAAIERAAAWIRRGDADVALAGGFDAISDIAWAGLSAMRTMTSDVIRPFDKRRNGTLFSEGAGVLALESLEHAQRRGATVLAEYLGGWTNNNAFHMAHPDKSGAGLQRAMRGALHEAGVAPEQVDHVSAHGTGTKYNDSIETTAIKAVLGDRAREIPVNSIKSMVGHGMGAAGAFEAVACVMTLREGIVPPTIHLEEPDPDCDLDYVADGPRECPVKVALSNSSGLGGPNSVIVLGRTALGSGF